MADAIRIIGIDPGLRRTGWGIVESLGNSLHFVAAGTVRSDEKLSLASRLCQLHDGLSQVVNSAMPHEAAVEQTFVNKDAVATLKLGQARGVAIVAATNQDLPVFEYAARQVKQTVVGIGSAEKSQVQHMVRTLLKLPANPQADAADALAIAITHCHVSQNAAQISESRLNLARGRLR